MKKQALCLMFCGAVAGCATQEEIEAAYWAGIAEQCTAMGFPNTPGDRLAIETFTQCVTTLHGLKVQEAQQQQAERARIGAALAGMGAAMQNAAPPPQPQITYPQNQPVNCTSNKIGETVYTNCR